jgi:uncharacterized membrane protein
MTKKELFGFFEKSYFHEIDIREKLNSRVQLPLAIIIAVMGLVGYNLNKVGSLEANYLGMTFLISTVISLVSIFCAVVYFIRSWRGHTYKFIPTSSETRDYLAKLQELYSPFNDKDELVDRYLEEYLYNAYVECSTTNANNNDRRSLYLHRNSKWLIIGFVAAFFSLVLVQLSDTNVRAFVNHVKDSTYSNCGKLYTIIERTISVPQKNSSPEHPNAPEIGISK